MADRIRRLERRDLPELVELCREHAAYERSAWVEYERTGGLERKFLASADARAWVVEGDSELAGFASATLELSTWDAGSHLHLDCLYLRPAYRGAGVGEALIAQVARTAVELDAICLQWQTPAWNEGAKRFYRRLGATWQEQLRFTLSSQQCSEFSCGRGR